MIFEDKDYDTILKNMLDKVPNTLDKREGSIIYDALAPAAAELAKMYIELEYSINLVFADTAVEEYLDKLCNQIGIYRNEATYSIKQGEFYDENNELIDIEVGTRFTCENLYWRATEKISTGIYKMQCETVGTIGNNTTGSLIPVDYVDKLSTAILTDLLIPGEDTEDDEALRKRYLETANKTAFGGNIEDYKEKTKALNGVGAVKVVPVWNGGGTVKLIILNSNYDVASTVLVSSIQEAICPELTDKGTGIAPIGHKVTVVTPTKTVINIITNITLSSTAISANVQNLIEEALEKYFLDLRKDWEDSESLTVRIAQIEAIILNVDGVIDISNTTINGQENNIEITQEYVPFLGNVEVSQ